MAKTASTARQPLSSQTLIRLQIRGDRRPHPGRPRGLRPLQTRIRRRQRLLAPDPAPPPHRHPDLTTGELAPRYATPTTACGNRRRPSARPARSSQPRHPTARPRGPGRSQSHPRHHRRAPCDSPPSPPPRRPVHPPRLRGNTILPRRPRRAASTRRRPPGRDISCPTRHVDGDPRLGQPLCPDCFDYEAAVLFNAYAADLWRRIVTYLPRHLARLAGVPRRCCRRTSAPLRPAPRVSGTRHSPLPRLIRLDAAGQPTSPRPLPTPLASCATPSTRPPPPSASPRPRQPALALGFAPQTDTRIIRHSTHCPIRAKPSTATPSPTTSPSTPPRPPDSSCPAADPLRNRHRATALPATLPGHHHRRMAARQHPARRTVPGLRTHARLRRALLDQIPPLLHHLRPAPHRTRRPLPRHPPPRPDRDA